MKQIKNVFRFFIACGFLGGIVGFLVSPTSRAEESKRAYVIHCTNGERAYTWADRCHPSALGDGRWVYWIDGGAYDTSMCTCRSKQ